MSVPQGFLPGGGHTVEMYGAARKKRSTERPLPGRSRKMVCGENLTETAGFAEEELFGYLQRMVKDLPENYHVVFSVDENLFPEGQNDGYRVQMEETGGRITGNNERSLLLAVYDYLHFIGCRFPLPLAEYEIVPCIGREKLRAAYEKQASFYHRGVCIEGADSFENILNYIEWLPKIGFNSFFLQFQTPYAFLARWYGHLENPYEEEEQYTPGDAQRDLRLLERAVKKRGLLLHEAGHGWTGEALGYHTVSWDLQDAVPDAGVVHRMAMINGRRSLYKGVPANTNLCYHNADAVDAFAELVTAYARQNPQTDYVHVWLADDYNNLCECPECRRTTLSDQYVSLLNEIDRRLSEEGIRTRIVFLLYQELLWPPVAERLKNEDRFVLMFAPISRTFEVSYMSEESGEEVAGRIPVFQRNQIVLPTKLAENMAFLKGWQTVFGGDGFVYDYPLGRAHYGDFGYIHMARVIYGDIQKLRQMGADGYISCQELRAAFPNALPDYVMARALFDSRCPVDEIIREYSMACYGEDWEKVTEYLENLYVPGGCDYVNGKGPRRNAEIAVQMERVKQCCVDFGSCLARHRTSSGGWETIFWEVLAYHKRYVELFSETLRLFSSGEEEAAGAEWETLRGLVCKNERKSQPFLDVYRVLEVTQRYTGLHRQQGKEEI